MLSKATFTCPYTKNAGCPKSKRSKGWETRFWIIVSGGKMDFTAKWWDPDRCQAIVDHFKDRILFVQCGEAKHHHPVLKNVIDLIGKTDLRQLVRLIYHSDGIVCPVTVFMHLAAAIETRPGRPKKHRAGKLHA